MKWIWDLYLICIKWGSSYRISLLPWHKFSCRFNTDHEISHVSSFVWKKTIFYRCLMSDPLKFFKSVEKWSCALAKKIRSNKPFFGIFWHLSILCNFCVQMTFYVKFLSTCYEKIRKSKVPKIVIFGRKPKSFSHLHFSTDFKNFNGSDTYETCPTSVYN